MVDGGASGQDPSWQHIRQQPSTYQPPSFTPPFFCRTAKGQYREINLGQIVKIWDGITKVCVILHGAIPVFDIRIFTYVYLLVYRENWRIFLDAGMSTVIR
jgi:hypothetical protein